MTAWEAMDKEIKDAKKKLKKCPFCSQDPDLLIQKNGFTVRCSDCNVNMNVYTKFPIQAVASWNFRDGKIDLNL